MLTGVAIEVSSTPLPRAVPLTPGAAATAAAEREGAGGTSSAVSSSDAGDRQGSWQQQQQRQKFAAAAAEKKDRTPFHSYHHPEGPPSSTATAAAAAAAATTGVGHAGAGGRPSSIGSSNACWSGNRTVPDGTAGASAAVAPASADRSWRASYASSLYCLLPAWLLRFRGPAYSPLRDDASATAASSTTPVTSSCCSSSRAAAAARDSAAATTGRGGAGGETPIGDAPFSTVCLHCHKAIVTTVAFKMSCFGICLCLLCPLLLGWPGLCLSPFLYIALKDAIHTCPQCRNVIHRRSRISIPFFGLRDEVVTLKCGNCAVVLSRRYLLLFAALLLLILLFYILRAGWLGSSLDVISKGPPAYMSWKQFYEQCGQRSQLGNSLKAAANFRESFAGKTVEWKGLVKQVKDGFFSSNVLMVVMSPTITLSGAGGGGGQSSPAADEGDSSSGDESNSSEEKVKSVSDTGIEAEADIAGQKRENDSSSSSSSSTPTSGNGDEEDLEEEAKAMQGDGADLALAFNGSELIEKVEKLEPGDRIEFEATLVTLGRRGKPSLGRLWNVSLVEKRETRDARLKEWRAKQAERQHLLQRLLLPLVGSPFSDFGFDPFSSLFSSGGGLGGTGVVVVRRQIISPRASFSVISSSSSSDDEPDAGLSSLFGGSGSISIEGLKSRGHEDEEKHQDVSSDEGGHLMFHVEDDEEEHLKGSLTKLVQQQPERTFPSHGVPARFASSGDDTDGDMHRVHAPAAEKHSNSGLYFSVSDDEDDEHQHDPGTGEAHGAAATAFGRAEIVNGKKVKPREFRDSAVGDFTSEVDPTLAALKLAVERQRQRRAQEEEDQRQQQRQQRTHPEPQKQPHHGKKRPVQHRKQQANARKEKEEEDGAKRSPHNDTLSPRKSSHMHGDADYEKHPGDTARKARSAPATYAAAASGMHHQQEQPQKQTQDVQGEQEPMTHETKASVDGNAAAPFHHIQQQQQDAMPDGRPAKSRTAETSISQP